MKRVFRLLSNLLPLIFLLCPAICGPAAAESMCRSRDEIIKDPKTGADYNQRGLILYYKGKYDEAIRDFTKALSLGPDTAVYLAHRGMAYNDRKEYERAIQDLDEAIRLSPKLDAAYVCRGYSYMFKGNAEKAKADWDKAIELSPSGAMALKNRAEYFTLVEKYDAALADLQKAAEFGGGDALGRDSHLRALLGKKDHDGAVLAAYDHMMRTGDVKYSELCWIYYAREGFTSRTRKYCVKGGNWTAWFVYSDIGEKEKAAEYRRKAEAGGGKAAEFYQWLGDHYNNRGELGHALWAYQKCAEQDKGGYEGKLKVSLPKFRGVASRVPGWYGGSGR